MINPSTSSWWLAFFVACGIIFTLLGERRLANPDEGRYAEIAREMAASNDFITPRLNGLKYFEKPPMQYWATAISFKLFGENEFAARLYTALAALGCVCLVTFVGTRLFAPATGLLAGMVLLSAPYFTALAGIPTLDMGLTFWLTAAVASFLLGQRAENPIVARRFMWLAAAGMAGAVLSKGLIGVAFPAAAVALYCAIQRDFSLLKRIPWASGLTVFFLCVSPWFILVSYANPEFPQFFFIHEHVERFTSTSHRRVAPAWYFLPILLAGIVPWTLALFSAFGKGWKQAPHLVAGGRHTFVPLRFLVIFCLFILLFFSVSGSKLPAYILPLFPWLALLIAVFLHEATTKKLAWMVFPLLPLALIAGYAVWRLLIAREADGIEVHLYQEMAVWLYAGNAALALAALVSMLAFARGRKWLGICAISLGTVGLMKGIELGYEKISPLQSGYAVAQAIKGKLTPDTRLYAVKIWDQSAAFYLGRTLTLVAYEDEFALGQAQEPEKSIRDLNVFPHAWNAPGASIAIIQPGDVALLHDLGLHFDIIHQDPRRVAIRKREPVF